MNQHDTLTLREALRSIQYEAASLADAQVIALQALNATYPARAALSATQPAQAAQPVQGLAPLLERIRPGVAAAPWVVEALQKLAAQAAQGAGEVVAIHPSWLDCWSFNECDRLARIWTAGIDLTKSDDHDNDLGPQWKVVMAIMLARLAHRAAVAPTQPAAGADVLDAERYRLLRCYALRGSWPDISQNPGVLVFTAHPDEAERFTLERLDAMLDRMLGVSAPGNISELRADYFEWRKAKTQVAIDAAIAASGRQE